jgi:hypothetical protein
MLSVEIKCIVACINFAGLLKKIRE